MWVLDNEFCYFDIIKWMIKLVDVGERVMFWDKFFWKLKDVNDMIRKEGVNFE